MADASPDGVAKSPDNVPDGQNSDDDVTAPNPTKGGEDRRITAARSGASDSDSLACPQPTVVSLPPTHGSKSKTGPHSASSAKASAKTHGAFGRADGDQWKNRFPSMFSGHVSSGYRHPADVQPSKMPGRNRPKGKGRTNEDAVQLGTRLFKTRRASQRRGDVGGATLGACKKLTNVTGDGSCLFRCVAAEDDVVEDSDELRALAVAELEANREEYTSFVSDAMIGSMEGVTVDTMTDDLFRQALGFLPIGDPDEHQALGDALASTVANENRKREMDAFLRQARHSHYFANHLLITALVTAMNIRLYVHQFDSELVHEFTPFARSSTKHETNPDRVVQVFHDARPEIGVGRHHYVRVTDKMSKRVSANRHAAKKSATIPEVIDLTADDDTTTVTAVGVGRPRLAVGDASGLAELPDWLPRMASGGTPDKGTVCPVLDVGAHLGRPFGAYSADSTDPPVTGVRCPQAPKDLPRLDRMDPKSGARIPLQSWYWQLHPMLQDMDPADVPTSACNGLLRAAADEVCDRNKPDVTALGGGYLEAGVIDVFLDALVACHNATRSPGDPQFAFAPTSTFQDDARNGGLVNHLWKALYPSLRAPDRKKKSPLDADVNVLMPMQISGSHWVLGIVNFRRKFVAVYDGYYSAGVMKKYLGPLRSLFEQLGIQAANLPVAFLFSPYEVAPFKWHNQHSGFTCGDWSMQVAQHAVTKTGDGLYADDIGWRMSFLRIAAGWTNTDAACNSFPTPGIGTRLQVASTSGDGDDQLKFRDGAITAKWDVTTRTYVLPRKSNRVDVTLNPAAATASTATRRYNMRLRAGELMAAIREVRIAIDGPVANLELVAHTEVPRNTVLTRMEDPVVITDKHVARSIRAQIKERVVLIEYDGAHHCHDMFIDCGVQGLWLDRHHAMVKPQHRPLWYFHNSTEFAADAVVGLRVADTRAASPAETQAFHHKRGREFSCQVSASGPYHGPEFYTTTAVGIGGKLRWFYGIVPDAKKGETWEPGAALSCQPEPAGPVETGQPSPTSDAAAATAPKIGIVRDNDAGTTTANPEAEAKEVCLSEVKTPPLAPLRKKKGPNRRKQAGAYPEITGLPDLRVPHRIMEIVNGQHRSLIRVGDVVAGLEPGWLLPNKCKIARAKYGNLDNWESIGRKGSCCFNWSHPGYQKARNIRLLVVVEIDTPAVPCPSPADDKSHHDTDDDSDDGSNPVHPRSSENSACWPGGENTSTSSCQTVRVREVCYSRHLDNYYWPQANCNGIVSAYTLAPLRNVTTQQLTIVGEALTSRLEDEPTLLRIISWINKFGTDDADTSSATVTALTQYAESHIEKAPSPA